MKKHAAAVRSTVFLAVVVFAIGANAETLLWYRFDGDGATIVNKANPGTMDGTLKSIIWGNGVDAQGNDSTKFPKRGDAFPEGTGIIDPVSGETYSGQVKSLSFTGDQSTAGMVLLKKANATQLLNLTSFTCEVFFKIPAAAASRTPALFPLVNWGQDQDQGWKFGFFRNSGTKLSPWFRGITKTSTGAKGSEVTVNAAIGNNDNYTYDTWHHLALVVDGAGDGSTATAKLILDYTVVQTLDISSYYGFYFNPKGGFPLTIGADMYRNRADANKRETFMGDIAEFRISDTALATDKLLKPYHPDLMGPIDEDTLVYLPMVDMSWFGSLSSSKYYGLENVVVNASYSPEWLYNSAEIPRPQVQVDSEGGREMRAGYLAQEVYPDLSSMRFFRKYNETAKAYYGHVIKIPYESMKLTEGSFTLEWFFKTDGQVPSGSGNNSMTFMNPTFAKIMINQADGKLKTRLIPHEGSYFDRDSAGRVDDGDWHHYALVYDYDNDKKQGSFAIFLDYCLVDSGSVTLATGTTSRRFLFGAETESSQAFAGQLDDFRITKRALKTSEFLTTREVVSQAALFSKFEGDLSSGQDTVIAPAGSTSSPAVYEGVSRAIDLDGDGDKDYESTKALKLTESSLSYPHNPLMECRDFTVEWFAKYDTVGAGAMLMRFERDEGKAVGDNTIVWALYYPSSTLRLGAWVSSDGAWNGNIFRSDKDFATKPIADGKWHHWALVAQTNPDATTANTTFKLYRDYEQVGGDLVFDKNGAGGILALPSTLTGTMLSMGTGANKITGLIDELRITPKVLAPEEFMHKIPGGLMLIVW